MVDIFTPEQRSKIMKKIKGRDTGPEKRVQAILDTLSIPYTCQDRDLPGTPDFVLDNHPLVICVNGCFWHRHDACGASRKMPKTNVSYWKKKFRDGAARESRDRDTLLMMGYAVLVVWECASYEDIMNAIIKITSKI